MTTLVNKTSVDSSSIIKRPASARGLGDHGWLKSRFSFSFADYYDPAHMGFRTLRVINDDWVSPGMGFGMHPHRDMEIFSYVLEGEIEHKDTLGNGRRLGPGEIQLMSAGTGVSHSEFNPSADKPLHLLQIWIRPRQSGLKPGYTEWKPSAAQDGASKVLVISPDGRENSAIIHQEADIYRIRLKAGEEVEHELREGRGVWIQMASGALTMNGVALNNGDGASCERAGLILFKATESAEAILFDLK